MTDQYANHLPRLSRGVTLDCTVLFELEDMFDRHRRRSRIMELVIRLVAYPVALAAAVSVYVLLQWIVT